MTPTPYLHASDLHGLARLAIDGVAGTSELVEQLHGTIARVAMPLGPPVVAGTRGITGLVYRSLRAVNGAVGTSINAVAGPLVARMPPPSISPGREHWLAIVNGVLGDHLADTENPLAIPMTFRYGGDALVLEPTALADRIASPSGKLLIAAHGLCMNDLHWGGAEGIPERLGRALGYTPLYLHYNSGRAIADNGLELAQRIETLVEQWPVPVTDIVIIGHSMGGLVARCALDTGISTQQAWAASVSRIAYLGTPHHGAPMERVGHRFESLLGMSPYSAPFTRLGGMRSAGIIDLRHGRLPASEAEVDEFAIAATARTRAGRLLGGMLGDELVPVDSALGRHPDPQRALPFPDERCLVVADAGHLGLLHHPEVYRCLRRWLR
ncbi:alpha/beta hydrolase [Wenzhouxiangella sp. EGI_FJ10409]|uniref:esterase/lipase family protein n=1 Tax=Wenzhouxiangella sp. EGI_FJ10409 TaxID=3243767 RepID=UPI0035DEEE85